MLKVHHEDMQRPAGTGVPRRRCRPCWRPGFGVGSDPITLRNLTFTFVESSGSAKSAVSVEVSQVGLNYALTFTGLSGNVAGIEDPPSPDGTELRYTVQVTSGSAVFDAVGLQVAATPAVSTKTSWYSGYFHMDAALAQTLANSGSVAGIDVDGS